MRFQVPQFIEVEDKIFGPLTLKQFIYLAGAAGISFVLWTLLPKFLAILVATPIVALALALAFYKVNNRPFINVVESALSFMAKDKLYVWRQEKKKGKEKKIEEPVAQSNIRVPKLSGSKLKDLAWSLDIKESIYSDESQQK